MCVCGGGGGACLFVASAWGRWADGGVVLWVYCWGGWPEGVGFVGGCMGPGWGWVAGLLACTRWTPRLHPLAPPPASPRLNAPLLTRTPSPPPLSSRPPPPLQAELDFSAAEQEGCIAPRWLPLHQPGKHGKKSTQGEVQVAAWFEDAGEHGDAGVCLSGRVAMGGWVGEWMAAFLHVPSFVSIPSLLFFFLVPFHFNVGPGAQVCLRLHAGGDRRARAPYGDAAQEPPGAAWWARLQGGDQGQARLMSWQGSFFHSHISVLRALGDSQPHLPPHPPHPHPPQPPAAPPCRWRRPSLAVLPAGGHEARAAGGAQRKQLVVRGAAHSVRSSHLGAGAGRAAVVGRRRSRRGGGGGRLAPPDRLGRQ